MLGERRGGMARLRAGGAHTAGVPWRPACEAASDGARGPKANLALSCGAECWRAVERLLCFKKLRQNAPVFYFVSRAAGARARAARTPASGSVLGHAPHRWRLRTGAIDARGDPHAKRRAMGRVAQSPTWRSRAAPSAGVRSSGYFVLKSLVKTHLVFISFRARQALVLERRAHRRLVRCWATRPIDGDFAQGPLTPVATRMRSLRRWGE